MPPYVYICHSSQETAVAESICKHLETGGTKCWLARRDIKPGLPNNGQITEAIRAAQAFILILSKGSNYSKQVLRDLERASKCKLPILTFRIDKTEADAGLAYYLSKEHWVDAQPSPIEAHFPALARETLALMQTAPEPVAREVEVIGPESYANFRIIRKPDGSLHRLGKGGMGVTWKAVDIHLDRPVALKVISADLLGNISARQRFLREAQAAAKIHHPHVAAVYQFGQERDSFFYAMEFVEGEDLEQYVARAGALTPFAALDVVSQVAEALEAAQQHQLIHRDIKPANLMAKVGRGGHLDVKLIDFGLAKGAKDPELIQITRSQDFVGSPAFASPEQCEMGELDTRSDIYSLGVTLWYLVSGNRPFSGTVGKVLIAHVIKPPPFEQLSGIPEPVITLLRRMLAKDRDDRPQNPLLLQEEVKAATAQIGKDTAPILDPVLLKNLPILQPQVQVPKAPPDESPTIAPRHFEPYLKLEVGATIDGRYRLIQEEPEGTGGRLFFAADQKATAGQPFKIALKLLHPGMNADSKLFDLLDNEIGVIRRSPHPTLIRYFGFDQNREHPFISREWVHGFLLHDLLRWRGSLPASELAILLAPLAEALDFVSQCGFGLVEVSARKMVIGCPDELRPDQFRDFARKDVREWPVCALRLNPLSLGPLLFRHRVNRETQTIVPGSQILSLTQAEAGIQGNKAVRLYGKLVYDLLSGHTPERGGDPQRYTPLPELNDAGNIVLRRACITADKMVAYKTCAEFWGALQPHFAERAVPRKQTEKSTPPPLPKPEVAPPLQPPVAQVPPVKTKPVSKAGGRRGKALAAAVVLAGLFLIVQAIFFRSPESNSNQPIGAVTPAPTAAPDAAALVVQANQEADTGNDQAAIGDYTTAIQLRPNMAETFYGRGCAYTHLKQYENAIADFNEAIQRQPDYALAYLNRGFAHYSLKQYDQAIEDYSTAIHFAPDNPLAYNDRGYAYAALNNTAKAEQDWKKARQLKARNAP